MEDMLKEFVVEALDLAINVEEHLLSLERNPGDMNTLNAVFRSFHTIKGGAGFMNLTAMVSACQGQPGRAATMCSPAYLAATLSR